MLQDIVITCANCSQQFVFTKDEQSYFSQKGLKPPTLCLVCRSLVKTARQDQFRGKMEINQENR